MTAELSDAELLAAMNDAQRRGVGWLRLLRITQSVKGDFRVTRIDPSLVVLLDDPTTYLDELLALVLTLRCPTCDVDQGDACRTVTGRCTTFHRTRSGPVYAAWRLGHRDGLIDALRRLTDDQDTPAAELLVKHAVRW